MFRFYFFTILFISLSYNKKSNYEIFIANLIYEYLKITYMLQINFAFLENEILQYSYMLSFIFRNDCVAIWDSEIFYYQRYFITTV